METSKLICLLILFLQIISTHCSEGNGRKLYIVYLGNKPNSATNARIDHHNLLAKATGDEKIARDLLVHSYLKSFNAFAANLHSEEADKLSGMDGIVSVFPSVVYKLQTTRSWDFIGFPQKAKRSTMESDVIVGMFDSGIWPHSPSFDDAGFGPPPTKWKGECTKDQNFTCNNKVIGARFFNFLGSVYPPDILSPIDVEGHGTHTASTAAGSSVEHANLYGLAEGTARGGVPSARIAVYKVCWISGCLDADILAAFDAAIDEGVDIISASLGGAANEYFADALSIGSFHAMKKGIITSLAGGNSGRPGSISNISPWALTVAATSFNREFRTEVELGDGRKLEGISINTYSPGKKMYPLISGGDAAKNKSDNTGYLGGLFCEHDYMEQKKVEGKIVACYFLINPPDVSIQMLGGAGVVYLQGESDTTVQDTAFTSALPYASVDSNVTNIINNYINTTRNSQAIIHKSHAITSKSIPYTASFSSRGPNTISPNILKPDVSAPGVDILAAWTRLSTVTGNEGDNRVVDYNIVSGTSMATPHVSGVAAYIKSFHPRWSPSAIKSAIMTTAKDLTSPKSPDAEFGYGSGQIDPLKALYPGLVYDMNETSYIWFMCNEGYGDILISTVTGESNTNCSAPRPDFGSDGLNYPSMQHTVKNGNVSFSAVFHRTVTNVGPSRSVYSAVVKAPKGLAVKVRPRTLVFDTKHRERSFEVVVKGEPLGDALLVSGSLTWVDSKHSVRSPIVITQPLPQGP